MKTKIKICGLTNVKDAVFCEKQGADFLGFIFSKSKRQIAPERAKKIISKLKGTAKKVGVFVNESYDFIKNAVQECSLDYIQLHGDETRSFICHISKIKKPIIKVVRYKKGVALIKEAEKYPEAKYFLADTYQRGAYGGTGKLIEYKSISDHKLKRRLFVAGGLRPDNVRMVLECVRPFAVDVSSGVELRPGQKSRLRIKQFMKAVTDE